MASSFTELFDYDSPLTALAKLLRLRIVPSLCWMQYQVAFFSFHQPLLNTPQVFLQLLNLKNQERVKMMPRAGEGC